MFGYIIVNKPELKIKEFEIYRSYYCGLCKALGNSGGSVAKLSLSYDMTFIYILLSGLYEPKTVHKKAECVLHPINQPMKRSNRFASFVADMSVIMTFYKGRDDWQDDGKFTGKLLMELLKKDYNSIYKRYPRKINKIGSLMKKIDEGERKNSANIDEMAGYFGHIMEEMFVCKKDMWEEDLRQVGFYLGKFVYLMDAYEDIEDDIKNNNYNPFRELYVDKNFEQQAGNILLMMMAQCTKAFEKLPIVENVELLRNILYSGVWVKYENIRKTRIRGKNNDKSL